jgi:proline dehydrogenase
MLKEIFENKINEKKLTKSFEEVCKKAIEVLKDLRDENDEEDVIERYNERIKEFEHSLKTGIINDQQFDFIYISKFCCE